MGQSASAARISDVFVKRDPTEKDTSSNSEASEIAHLRIKADSAELEKKNIQLLLQSEQQKRMRFQVVLDQQRKRNEELNAKLQNERKSHDNALRQASLELEKQRAENQEMKKQLVEMENAAKQNEQQKMAELTNATKTLHKLSLQNAVLSSENERLTSNGEQLSITFAAVSAKCSNLETKVIELGLINQQLSNSTATLQNTFLENVQALNTLSAENSTLKSMLGNNSVCDPRRERIMIKLQERRQLLTLVKTARVAAEVTRRKGKPHEVPATSLVQAKLYQNVDSIVSVMRAGEWVEAIPLKKKNSCVQWFEYIDDGVQEVVSDERIAKSRKRRLLHYAESPSSPKSKVKKQRKG
jgi:chromosome segregation ATPase